MSKANKLAVVAQTSAKELTQREVLGTPNRKPEIADLKFPSVVIGRVAAIAESGEALVDFPGNVSGSLVPARSLVSINPADVGRQTALTFEDGDPSLPIVAGFLQEPQRAPATQREVKVDGESLLLSAKNDIVLQCGRSSITLTAAGKVLIRGAYLLSRSSGVNRIKGGSVQIN